MQIVELKRREYQDYELVFEYETSEHYAVSVSNTDKGFSVELKREKLPAPAVKRFTECLFQRYLARPSVYAAMEGGRPVAFLELDREFWIRRMRITDLLVLPEHRRRGCGAALRGLRWAGWTRATTRTTTRSAGRSGSAWYIS